MATNRVYKYNPIRLSQLNKLEMHSSLGVDAVLIEPITQRYMHILQAQLITGDSKGYYYVLECEVDPILLRVSKLDNMVFILKRSGEFHTPVYMQALPKSMFVKTKYITDSKNNRIYEPIQSEQTYGGIMVVPVDNLQFIEGQESINSERMTEALKGVHIQAGTAVKLFTDTKPQ